MRRTLTAARELLASTPVPQTSRAMSTPGGLLGFGRRSTRAELAAYGSVGTLFVIVSQLAGGTARAEWHLYRKRVDQRRVYGPAQDNRTEVTSHQALKVMQRPNEFMPWQEFAETSQMHVDLTGRSWWVIEHTPETSMGRIPVGMWPIRPDRIVPVPDPEEFISGYVYIAPDGERVPLTRDQVIEIKMPDPDDPYGALGPVQSILREIDAAKYSAEWNAAFFKNSALPGGIIELERSLNETEFQKMVRRWRESHQGASNAHRVGILEFGKWRDVQMSMKDMQFEQLRHVSQDLIREVFAYPKFLLGEPEGSNRASAMAAEYVEARRLLVPRLERFKSALNVDFLPLFGDTGAGLEFDFESPVPDDEEADVAHLKGRADAAAVLVAAHFDPDDVLEVVGLPPMRVKEPAPPPPVLVPAPAPPADPAEPDGEPAEDPDGIAARWRAIMAAEGLTGAVLNGHARTGRIRR